MEHFQHFFLTLFGFSKKDAVPVFCCRCAIYASSALRQ